MLIRLCCNEAISCHRILPNILTSRVALRNFYDLLEYRKQFLRSTFRKKHSKMLSDKSCCFTKKLPASVASRHITTDDPTQQKASNSDENYHIIERGQLYTTGFKCYIADSRGPVSPWHDIPLIPAAHRDKGIAGRVFNMVVEIPRWSCAKMEVNKAAPFNPIMQDVKNGKTRFVHNIFPYHGYIWNYGTLPQTWEDPESKDVHTGCVGDADPIDALELGEAVLERGAVVQIKVLGVFALIDEGETDWKLLCINVNDPLASQLESLEDVERLMPGYLKASKEWFRIYKVPAGKPENQFGMQGDIKDAAFACKIVEETHQHWLQLTSGARRMEAYSCNNARLQNATSWKNVDKEADTLLKASETNGTVMVNGHNDTEDQKLLPNQLNKWHFIGS